MKKLFFIILAFNLIHNVATAGELGEGLKPECTDTIHTSRAHVEEMKRVVASTEDELVEMEEIKTISK